MNKCQSHAELRSNIQKKKYNQSKGRTSKQWSMKERQDTTMQGQETL